MSSRRLALLACVTVITAPGCVPVVAGVATPMLIRPQHVNLLNSSYAAADTLIQQSRQQRYPREAPIVVLNLEEILSTGGIVKNPKASPMLGRVIATQMRARFQQLGYTLAGTNGVPASDTYATVSGAYKVVGTSVNISLRFRDINGGRVLGIYDYILPTTAEVRKYLVPEANAFPALDYSTYPDFNF